MKIKNGLVFSADNQMHQKDLCFENGVITEHSEEGKYDASGCYVLPGLIDTHLHGLLGMHFATSDESLKPALDWLCEHGVTSIMPTMATRSKEDFIDSFHYILSQNDDRIIGIHAEGPFLNKKFKGGMVEEYIVPPNVEYLQEIYDASEGYLKLLSLSPELEGAKEVIELCNELGIKTSMAHSDANYEQAKQSVKWGITRMTHTYNAMRSLHHREPGILGYAFDDERVNCELICDLVHVSAPMIRLAIKAKGYERITMISDSEMFCGLGME
ncbi:MAG: N-acetylglucosamine-6-phosphate deacetylase, partial [Ruminococcaceae bacterium]|nr:N-acetylglucosamine-6-phosphate deacetylase [Oscillospiraceae bacterium]